MNELIFISFYTKGSIYEEMANKQLIPSLHKFNLPFQIYTLDNYGSWAKNTIQKPVIILEALNQFKKDIVWTDADSVINCYPSLLFEIPQEYDIAVCNLSWEEHYGRSTDKGKFEIIDGTFLVRNNDKMKKFIEEWKHNSTDIGINHQKVLERMLKERIDIKRYNLPRSYCYITTRPNGIHPAQPIENPIISHYQASRKTRNENR